MLMKVETNIRHQSIKLRKVLHYIILMLLAIAISLPAAILPPAKSIQAAEPIAAPLPVPGLLSPYNGAFTNDNTVDLIWEDVDPPYPFEYQVDNNSDFSSPEVKNTSAVLITYVLQSGVTIRAWKATTPALSDGKYYWRVRTYGLYELGAWSSSSSFTVDTVPTAAPGLVSPVDGSQIASSTPTLDWNAPAGVAYFEWQIADNATFSTLFASATTTSSVYTFPSPIPCNHYYWRVRAFDIAGNVSNWSPTWDFLLLYPPQLVYPANDSFIPTLTPALNWSVVPGNAVTYQVQVDNQSDFSSPNTNAYWLTGNTYTTVTLRESITYYWRVRSHQGTATSPWSPVWHFTTDTLPPSMPALVTPFNGTNTIDTTPTLDWNASSGASSYEWQLSNMAAFTPDPYAHGTTSSTDYTFPSSLPYGTYYWRVRMKLSLAG